MKRWSVDILTTSLSMLVSKGFNMKNALWLIVQALALVGVFGFIGVLLALGV